MKKIFVVGAGIEGHEGFSRRALELVRQGEVLFGRAHHLALFPDFPGEKVVIDRNFSEVVERLRETSLRAVVLSSGDPLFFGIGRQLLRNFRHDELEFIPNVTSIQYAFSKIKEPWDNAVFVSAQDRDVQGAVDRIIAHDKTAILTDEQNTPSVIAGEMLRRGRDGYVAYLCENLGMAGERIVQTDLRGLLEMPTTRLNLLILIKQYEAPGEALRPLLGIADEAFSGVKKSITREEVRAVALAKLRLRQDMILWDIGAGSGSVSIEADALLPNGRIFAVESDSQCQEFIREGLQRFRARNVVVIAGEAPECLDALPDPQRVFIGGSGGKLWSILEAVDGRLPVEGRVVITAVTLDTLTLANEFFDNAGYRIEVTALNVARTRPGTDFKMFEAFNPVFIIVAEKA